MNKLVLILYSRKGCCLCSGLEERLKNLSLNDFKPPLELKVLDIDSPDVVAHDRLRYDLEVPVMILQKGFQANRFELPRVSPRLNNEGLFKWIQKLIDQSLLVD